jgi:signal transduction histidine kinase/CheY-like chemotaxis protein/PAS domain-containing protein
MADKKSFDSLKNVEKQGAFARTIHSIRTRYSLATAAFILVCLTVFYVGGRIVLVHLMREAEDQVREIGYDISRVAYKQADAVRRASEEIAASLARRVSEGATPRDILSEVPDSPISILISLGADGGFSSGAVRVKGGPALVTAADVAPYVDRFSAWAEASGRSSGRAEVDKTAIGIVQLRGTAHYVFMYPRRSGDSVAGWVVLGTKFDSSAFTSNVNDGFGGLDVRVVNRKNAVSVSKSGASASSVRGDSRNDFGISPMLSEAMNFYSGGFWDLGSNPFEAVFAIRDIAGNAVSMISVSLPASFANVTRSALGRLAFFVSMAGIFLIVPVFWFQAHVLLDPLTKMTEAIRRLGDGHRSIDCPRLEWEGKDEFATLALSVNMMLETITARAVEVAQVESRQRALIDGIPDALAVLDRRGRLVSIMKQPEGTPPLVGFKAGEPPCAEVFGEDACKGFQDAVESVFAGRGVVTRRFDVLAKAGGGPERNFEVRLARMDEVFALAIMRDVTKEVAEHKLRLAAESRALDASKRESLTLFAAGIAHDVNNVLSVILGTVDSYRDDCARSAEITIVRDAVMRGSKMMKELMEFAGDSKVSLLRVSPAFLITDVKGLLSKVVGANVAIDYRFGEGLPDVDADPNRFWKVIFNIVKNAGEALHGRPGTITVSVDAFTMTSEAAVEFMSEAPLAPGPGVLFRIKDNGPGISSELLPRLFDPYVSSKAIGRGLGLATVRTIVETHGGGLKVESELEKGTSFLVYLPQTKMPEDLRPGLSVGHAVGDLPGEVLVVDDDEAILKTLSMLLHSLCVKAHVAHDRQEAMAVIRRRADALGAILLDAHIGDIDVVRLFQAFRNSAPDVPVILVSGSHEDEVLKLFKSRVYDAFLAKPFTLAELRETLASALASRFAE